MFTGTPLLAQAGAGPISDDFARFVKAIARLGDRFGLSARIGSNCNSIPQRMPGLVGRNITISLIEFL